MSPRLAALWGGRRAFWRARRAFLFEGFLAVNLAFLSLDILLAHATNGFARVEEWIPFGFSVLCALVLLPVTALAWRRNSLEWANGLVIGFGIVSILVGLGGLVFHLECHFLREQTLKHLVYTAPFAAPLAYAGIGSLLVMNRQYARAEGWALGVLFGALGGFFGNFVLALCDHAQNGFFRPVEWVAVAAPAFATGFLAALILVGSASRTFVLWVAGILLVQGAVGTAGFAFHAWANLHGSAPDALSNFIHGAPAFAPLLFVNISILAGFGVLDLLERGGPADGAQAALAST